MSNNLLHLFPQWVMQALHSSPADWHKFPRANQSPAGAIYRRYSCADLITLPGD